MSNKLYRGNLTAEQYIDYLRKEVFECNRFHKKIIVNLEKQLKDANEEIVHLKVRINDIKQYIPRLSEL